MNRFPYNEIENYYELAGLFPPAVDLYNIMPSLTASELRCSFPDPEFDSYSDVSIDTSSVQSFDSSYENYMIKENGGNFIHPQMRTMRGSSFMENVNPGREDTWTISSREVLKSHRSKSSRYSDDKMTQFFHFDKGVLPRAKTMDEQEELRYLAKLVQQDIAAAEYFDEGQSGAFQDPLWNMEAAYRPNADFYSDLLMWNKLREENFLKKQRLLKQKEMLKWKLSQVTPQSGGMLNRKPVYPLRMNSGKQHIETLRHVKKKFEVTSRTEAKEAHELLAKYLTRDRQREVAETKKKAKSVSTARSVSTDSSSGSNGDQRVFLGGLPIGMTERTLRQQLAAQGYKVLKRPKILHGFAPEVLMRSVEEAKDLVEKGVIMIDGFEVEVRPFNSLMKQSESKKIPNIGKRSVFLGGLSPGTTAKDITDAMTNMGMKIVNYPVIKFGFSRQVIFETISQAKALINMKRVMINGTYVDVRPFVNQQNRKRVH